MQVSQNDKIDQINQSTHIKRVLQLFLQPSTYFTNFSKLDHKYIHIFTYCVAIFMVMDRIDSKLIKLQIHDDGDYGYFSFILESWLNYWGVVLVIALVASILVWFFYGWWYEVRLKWCGVKNVAPQLARQVNIAQWFIIALPTLILTMTQTILYENYLEAFDAPVLWVGLISIIFSIYSVWVSYLASKIVFQANKFALLWFLLLPLLVYSIVIIAFGYALSS